MSHIIIIIIIIIIIGFYIAIFQVYDLFKPLYNIHYYNLFYL